MTMHAGHRERLIARFQTPDTPANAVLLFEGGHAETRHETDHEPVFRQESFFAYLFGVKEPDCYGVRMPSASSAPQILHAAAPITLHLFITRCVASHTRRTRLVTEQLPLMLGRLRCFSCLVPGSPPLLLMLGPRVTFAASHAMSRGRLHCSIPEAFIA